MTKPATTTPKRLGIAQWNPYTAMYHPRLSSGANNATAACETGITIIFPIVRINMAMKNRYTSEIKPYIPKPIIYSSVPKAIIFMGAYFEVRLVIQN